MTTAVPPWTVRLTATAEADFREILRWTLAQFGKAQARLYAETLSAALEALTAGPTVTGARERRDIAKGLYTLHVARKGRKGRHFVMFRIGHEHGCKVIEVLRLLHDAMDPQRHLPSTDERTEQPVGGRQQGPPRCSAASAAHAAARKAASLAGKASTTDPRTA